MKVWLLPKNEQQPSSTGILPDIARQSPRKTKSTVAPKPDFSGEADAPPPNAPSVRPQLPELTRPPAGNSRPAAPSTEVDYAMALPDVTPTRRKRMDIGEAPIKELAELPEFRTYTPLTKKQRTGFKGRVKGAFAALQNAGAAGADGGAVLGALIGGAASPERANQIKWQRTVELPDIRRRKAQEDSILNRNKAYVETYKSVTEAENADRGFYDKDAEREKARLDAKAGALQRRDKMDFEDRTAKQKHDWEVTDKTTEYERTSAQKALERTSAEKIAQMQADTSRQNNVRTNQTNRQNNRATNAAKLQTSKRYPRRLIPDLAKKLGENEGEVIKRLIENGYVIED